LKGNTLRDILVKILGILALVFSVWVAFNGTIIDIVTHDFGCLVIFLAVYAFVRATIRESTAQAGVANLEGVEELTKGSEEFQGILDAFELACVARADRYPFWLQLGKVYRKTTPAGKLARTSEGQRLFHGTKWENAQGILCDGFRLPSHPGMFGKGIYFADCPLKCWQYTDGMPWRPGVVLCCWVELGRPKCAKSAMGNLSRPPQRSFWEWLTNARAYDSVKGEDQEAGGALRVPEYIVYDPERAQIDYILEVWSVPKGTPPPE
jgi:hypothetical protein